MKLGDKIKMLLKEQNLTQNDLSNAVGKGEDGKFILPNPTLSDIINGRASEENIGVGKILGIAKALGVSVEYLFDREEPGLNTLSGDDREILKLWRNSTPSGREAVSNVLRCNQLPIKKESAI